MFVVCICVCVCVYVCVCMCVCVCVYMCMLVVLVWFFICEHHCFLICHITVKLCGIQPTAVFYSTLYYASFISQFCFVSPV